MTSTTETITRNFPHPTLTPLCDSITDPTFESIQIAQIQLNANSTSIHSNGGDGEQGHLSLTVTPEEYVLTSTGNVPFIAPINPPVNPDHAANATVGQISENNRIHLENQKTFRQYHDIDKALRNQLIEAVPAVYITTLSHPQMGFGKVTCLQILTHLKTTYGKITDAELEANTATMIQDWPGPPVPIEHMFERFEKAVLFAAAGNDPISGPQVIRHAYNTIRKNGLFDIACREWRNKTEATKIWTTFKTHFKSADSDLRLTMTAGTAGFHGSANYAEVSTALAASQAALAASEATLARTLTQQANIVTRTTSARAAPALADMSYCHTHGSVLNPDHTSATCKNPAEGHKTTATARNKQGGSDKIWKPSRNFPGTSSP